MTTRRKKARGVAVSARLNAKADRDLIDALSHIPHRERSAVIRAALRACLIDSPGAPSRPVARPGNERLHTTSHTAGKVSDKRHTPLPPQAPMPIPPRAERKHLADLREAGQTSEAPGPPTPALPAGFELPIALRQSVQDLNLKKLPGALNTNWSQDSAQKHRANEAILGASRAPQGK
jgi:hypothetical protein